MLDLSRIPILGKRKEDQEQWYYHSDFSVAARSVKPELNVYLRQRDMQVNWVVTDKDPQGVEYITMTVQEPSGAYRAFDGRTIERLRQNFQRGPDLKRIVAELEAKEAKRELAVEKADLEVAEAVADDLKWAGTDVTPSTAWRDRTQPIKKESSGSS